MSEYIVDEKRIGDLLVEVVHDSYSRGVEDFIGDLPVVVFSIERGGVQLVHDTSAAWRHPKGWLAHLVRGEQDELFDEWVEQDANDEDWDRDEDCPTDHGEKKFRLRVARLFAQFDWSSASDRSSTYYAVWCKAEMEAHIGRPGYTPDLTDYVENNVWGYRVSRLTLDEDGDEIDRDEVDSCWGFIGDWECCMAEGEAAALTHIKETTDAQAA